MQNLIYYRYKELKGFKLKLLEEKMKLNELKTLNLINALWPNPTFKRTRNSGICNGISPQRAA